MISRFSGSSTAPTATAQSNKDEVYALSGLNMVTPDQIIDLATRRYNRALLGESPYTINSRMLSRDDGEHRVPIRTRKGSSLFNGLQTSSQTPLTIANSHTQSTEQMFSSTQQIASPIIVPSYSLPYGKYTLSFIDIKIRKTSGSVESVDIKIWDNLNNQPHTLLAHSSFDPTLLSTSSTTVRVFFMDAPDLSSNTTYWMTMEVVDGGSVQCFVAVSADSGGLYRSLSVDSAPWFSTGTSVIYSAPAYRSGSCLSAFRRNVVGEVPITLIATGYGDVISFNNTGTSTQIYSYAPGYNKFSNKFRFVQVDNLTIFCNKIITPQKFDGTNTSALTNAPAGAENMFLLRDRLVARVGNRYSFTDLLTTTANTNSWPSVNFFYPSTPNDPDTVIGEAILNGELYAFTRKTKYRITLDDSGISSINIKEVPGGHGGTSQSLIDTDDQFIYFIASDNRLYRFNGVTDELLSDNVEPEIRAVQNPELYGSLHIHNNQIRYYYAKSPDTEINRMLLFDLTYKQWFLDTGRKVAFSIDYPLEDNNLYEFSSKTTLIFLGEQDYSDVGKPIDFKYWTNYKAYGSGAAKKRVKRLRPIMKVSTRRFTMQVGKDMDFRNQPDMRDYLVGGSGVVFGGGAKYGDGSVYGSSTLVDKAAGVSGRGKHIQYRFEKNGVNTPVEMYGYISLFKEGTNK